VSYSQEEFRQLKQALVTKFLGEYSGEVVSADIKALTAQAGKLKI